MARKTSSCAMCENSNLASICVVCVNQRLSEYNTSLKSLRSHRDALYMRLAKELQEKKKADDQRKWRIHQNEKFRQLKERQHFLEKQLSQGKIKIERMSSDLKVRYALLELAKSKLNTSRVELLENFYPNLICTQNLGHMAIASELIHKQSVAIKQICRLFPLRRVNLDVEKKDHSSGLYDQICNVRLPRGLDPHSVPSEELSASLGYLVQFLNLVVPVLAAPVLHNSGFAGSCSRIWQRNSYWDARPSSRSNEYPLFIPRQNFCSNSGENSWSDRSSSNFGVTSVLSERKPHLDSLGGGSFNYSAASPHSIGNHEDLQKGISLLKKSVACITAYCYNSLCLEVASEVSTFEAFAKLLATLSSSKELQSVLSLKTACSRSYNQVQQLNKSTSHVVKSVTSSSLVESSNMIPVMRNVRRDDSLLNSGASFLYAIDVADPGKSESLVEGWDIVERPTFPPPPSQSEDIEHWTRAMLIDVTKR
ncbi:hypothetical protein QJS10_CPB12g01283 [Acorus calamus]|uniref:UV radiation resistance protein/autophagy-related protein 14 n=1 Tax=Acorus calamus TaxID=4465 RepID=A0AAV9DPF4_ACOCL|nr:hypothetical protein QJS10_CPB12g01283 [Acorus calamus]